MAFFYPPPPPSQSASYAPPVPHEPPPTPGDEPPRRQVQTALAIALVLASWPASLEPRLQAPNNQQVKIAPLTLAIGDQPPAIGPITPSEYAQTRLLWEPIWASQRAPFFVPPTPGDQPVPLASQPPTELLINQSWARDWTLSQGPPKSAATIPPPVVVTNQPYVQPFMGRAAVLDWPAQRAPLSIPTTQGDQPPVVGPLTATELLIVQSWPRDWPAQTGAKCAAWFVPPVVNVPIPIGPISANTLTIGQAWPRDWGVPQRLATLVQPLAGSQPRPWRSLSIAHLWTAWEPGPPSAQASAKSSAAIPPPAPFAPGWAKNRAKLVGYFVEDES